MPDWTTAGGPPAARRLGIRASVPVLRTRGQAAGTLVASSREPDGNHQRDDGAARLAVADHALAAEAAGPLAHAEQAQPGPAPDVRQAGPVVADLQLEAAAVEPEIDLDRSRAGVAGHVGQGFLEDAEGGGRQVAIELEIAEVRSEE